MATVSLDYLIQDVRIKIGDYTEPYRYLDTWIFLTLGLAAKKFQRYNKSKYLIDADGLLYRNPESDAFITTEATEGVIERRDEDILTIMTAIIILQGSLENSAWNTASWKDAEISFSNLEGGRLREGNLKRMTDELNSLILAPTRRLATPDKQSLPGYKNNDYEHQGDF